MFKCPGYHCIPWSYVCDGKWDCPHGYDELENSFWVHQVKNVMVSLSVKVLGSVFIWKIHVTVHQTVHNRMMKYIVI